MSSADPVAAAPVAVDPGAIVPAAVDPGTAVPPAKEAALLDPDCELCEAARFTHWYYEDELCWVADCEMCATPMVVWKQHASEPTEAELTAMLAHLTDAGERRFGPAGGVVDRVMRQIPDHFHAHYRLPSNAIGAMSSGWGEPLSKYTGVGTDRVTR